MKEALGTILLFVILGVVVPVLGWALTIYIVHCLITH
jgi:hypothetical protein